MIVLLNQYKNARKELRNMLATLGTSEQDKEDRKLINSMIASTSDIIEWLETGKNPYFQQGIERNHVYHLQYLSNMDILPDLTERFKTERETLKATDEQIRIVQKAIMKLSDRERDCLLLHVAQDMSMSEVSEQLGISKASVQTYINRAREKIEQVVK